MGLSAAGPGLCPRGLHGGLFGVMEDRWKGEPTDRRRGRCPTARRKSSPADTQVTAHARRAASTAAARPRGGQRLPAGRRHVSTFTVTVPDVLVVPKPVGVLTPGAFADTVLSDVAAALDPARFHCPMGGGWELTLRRHGAGGRMETLM